MLIHTSSYRRCFSRILTLAAVILFFFSGMTYSNQPLIITGTPEKPFRYSASDGEIIGIDVEMLAQVFNTLSVPYEFRIIKIGSRIIKQAQQGKIDMVMSFSRKKSRESYLIYPTVAYNNFTWNFFIRQEDENRIIFNSFEDLIGFTIGATQDWAYTPEFWQADLNLDIVSNNNLHIPKLLKKRIDLVPLNTFPTILILQEQNLMNRISFLPKPLKSKPYYNAFSRFSKNTRLKKVIDSYDKIIQKLIDNGTVKRLYNKHLGVY